MDWTLIVGQGWRQGMRLHEGILSLHHHETTKPSLHTWGQPFYANNL